MSFSAFLSLTSAFIQIILGFIVLIKAPGKRENRLFSLILFLFMLWSIAEYNVIISGLSGLSIKFLFTPGILMAYFFCVFTAIYPENQADARIIRSTASLLLFFIPAGLLLVLLWSNRLLTSFSDTGSGFSMTFGSLEFVIKGILVGYLYLALTTLSNSRKNASTKIQIRRFRYTFTAMLLPVAAGSIIIAFSRWFIGGETAYAFGLFPVLNIIMSVILSYTMLKYNLMEIDLIFSIGLVYTLLTAILAGSMELFQELMQAILNFSDLWSRIISILIIAAVFSPLKEFLIKLVDKFFGRQNFDSAKVMQTILNEMRKIPDQEKLYRRLVSELQLVLDFSFAVIDDNSGALICLPEHAVSELPKSSFRNLPEDTNDIEAILHHYAETGDNLMRTAAETIKSKDIRHYFPIMNSERFYGAFLLGPKNSRVPYTDTELNLVQGLLNEIPHIIENLQMIKKLLDQEKISQEIQWARRLLHAISASSAANNPERLKIATYSSLSGEIKGDMIDICHEQDNFFIGVYDAFHQGIQAVLTLNIIFAVFRCFKEITDKLVHANRTLRQFGQELCSAITVLQCNAGNLVIANAGNPPPLVIGKKNIREITAGKGTPAGLHEQFDCPVFEIELQPDEFLFVSTNGLFKAFEQLYGHSLQSFLGQQEFSYINNSRDIILKSIEPISRKSNNDT
jgi:hypothetical protein